MEKFVITYQETDNYTYWIDQNAFIEHESIETLYLELQDIVEKQSQNAMNHAKNDAKSKHWIETFNSYVKHYTIDFRGIEIALSNFVYAEKNIGLIYTVEENIYRLEQYFDENKLIKK